jgi:hypothetical protein
MIRYINDRLKFEGKDLIANLGKKAAAKTNGDPLNHPPSSCKSIGHGIYIKHPQETGK